MSNIPSKTQIGEIECAGCGEPVPLKVNVNQCVYAYCARVLDHDEAGKVTEKCMTRFQMGRKASQKVIQKYLSTQGTPENDQHSKSRKEQLGDSESQRTEPSGEGGNGCGAERKSGDHTAPKPSGDAGADPEPPNKLGTALKHFFTADE